MKTAGLGASSLCAFVLAQSAVAQNSDLSPPALERLRPLDVPAPLASAADVRWQPDGGLQVGLRQDGVHFWRPGTRESELVATLAGTTYRRAARYGNYSRLGGGPSGDVVFAGDLFGVYRQRDGRITALKTNLEIVGDLDQRDGWAVAVGLSRQPEPAPGPDDIWEPYVAWLFDAEGGVRGLLPTRDGGVALDACYPVELSLGRFVADDLVLVVPGAEPGVFVYGTDGALRGAMETGAFSASRPDCGPEQKSLLYEEEFRSAWLSGHRVIDEVVANGEGDVFFFVRHVRVPSVRGAKVCWDIVHAPVDDLRRVSTSPCAVTSELADARLRADVSGDRAVLLIRGATRLASGNAERPAELFEARLRAGS